MADVILQHMTNGQNISAANSNFDKIQDNINNHSIQSDSGNNVMYQDFDLNGHNLLNVPVTTNQNGVVRRSELTAETSTRLAVDTSLQTQINAISTPGGSFTQDGIGAVSRPWNNKVKEFVSLNDYRLPTDTDAQVFNKAVAAVVSLFGEGTVVFPNGTFNFNNVSVPLGVRLEGSGKTFIQSPSNLPILTLLGNNVISKLKFVGFGSGTTDRGLVCNGISNIEVFDCSFTNFRKEPFRLTNVTNADIHHCHFYSNYGDDTGINTAPAESEICFVDNCDSIRACNNRFFANATRPKQIAIFPSAQTLNAKWTNGTFNDNLIKGYARGGIYPDDENTYTTINTAFCTINGNTIINSGQEAIKTKNVWFVTCVGNIINGFELISQEIFGNLQGGIFLNSSPGSTISGNTIIGAGISSTCGIQVAGSTPVTWTYDSPLVRLGAAISGNHIYNCGREAIWLSQCSQTAVSGNQIFNCAGFINVRWDSANPTRINNNITISGNSYRGIGFGGQTGALMAVTLDHVTNCVFTGNIVNDCGANGINIVSCTDTVVSNSQFYNAGSVGSSFLGIRVNACTNTKITGCTASNRNGHASQTYGLQVTTGNTGLFVADCDFSGNTTGAVDPASIIGSDTYMRDINGYLSNTVSWTPGTIANNAQTNQGVGIAGVALGDYVQVVAPYDLLGATVSAYVTSTNNIRIIVSNNSGASITLASGIWKVRVTKRA